MHKKITILEDDAGIRDIITFLLEEENFEVNAFADVSSFMARDMQSSPDLYLLDIKLPDGNGLEVCRMLKSENQTSNTPVIMMSAHEGLNEMRAQCNAEDFVTKPFDIFDLLARINVLIP